MTAPGDRRLAGRRRGRTGLVQISPTASGARAPRRALGTAAAGAAVLVVLVLGGCGRIDATGSAGTPGGAAPGGAAPGASAATASPAPATPREDVATPAATGPAATGVATLQQALDAAGALADEVDRDIASDNS